MKSKIVAGIFGILLGSFGIHKFYLGKPVMGILYILFFGQPSQVSLDFLKV